MKKRNFTVIPLFLSLIVLLFSGCEDYINNVEPLREYAPDEKLNSQDNVEFLRIGVLSQFADASSQVSCFMDLLSDQMIFTTMMPYATYPTYNEIETGAILGDNTNVDQAFQSVCRLRKVADDLIRRTNLISFDDPTIKDEAHYTGYLYGGIARYYLANAFSVDATTPGGVIDAGPFIPRTTLLDDAVARLLTARGLASDPAMVGVINSLIAKCYLAKEDYANAATYAAAGMQPGDDPFVCRYNNSTSNNYYWLDAGNNRQQMGMNPRFRESYLANDPAEANRILLDVQGGRDGGDYDFQVRYPEDASSFPIMTWQENTLMLAEFAVRGISAGDPVALVNAVRASHTIAPDTIRPAVGPFTIDSIMVERDKELYCTGTRLIDQNRGGVLPGQTTAWDIATGSVSNSNHWIGQWRYMPIPRRERDSNPNLPPY